MVDYSLGINNEIVKIIHKVYYVYNKYLVYVFVNGTNVAKFLHVTDEEKRIFGEFNADKNGVI